MTTKPTAVRLSGVLQGAVLPTALTRADLTPRALARRVLPGPWGARRIVQECVAALLVGGLGGLVQLADSGPAGALAVGLAAALLCLLRRGLPGPVLVLAAAALGGYGGFMPVLVLAGWSAGYRIARPLVLTAASCLAFAAVIATSLGINNDGLPVRANLVVTAVGFLLLAVLPAVIGRYRAQRRALLTALQERNAQLLRERAMIAHQARLRERHRIAQDMHDSLGHQLALIAVHTGALEVDRTLSAPQREAVGVLRQAATGAMRELREVVGLLRDDTLPEAGGVAAVEGLVEASRAAGTEVALDRAGDPRPLPAATGHAAYRIVQEGLTNAHKHAPGAAITVALRYEPDALVVEVHNGPPAAGADGAVRGGQGLTGLHERARLLGGMVHAGPVPDGGFRLAGVLPYDGAGRAEGTGPEDGLPDDLGLGLPVPPDPAARRSPALGCALGAGLVLLASLGALVWAVATFIHVLDNATLPRETFDRLAVGSSEQEVRRQLPAGSNLMTSDYRGQGPPVPAGASCSWFISGEDSAALETETVLRLCFRDGRLVEKQHYPAR
ncbi:signal transduction histidine kinase [Streptomyces sp. TLI_235]|nr:sensor histidine kinase [Streptomyces sp. TLI_235]PBC70886.1 signal transduction histidine kinase [Streptomyces sp. TLI_235]